MCGCLSRSSTEDLARNPVMCPDWELNQRPFGPHAVPQSTEPHQPGPNLFFQRKAWEIPISYQSEDANAIK